MAVFYIPGKTSVMEQKSMAEAFPFLMEKQHIVSLVGAGGKTSLMYGMAEVLCQKGHKVLVTTSTHIAYPDISVMAETIADVERIWEQGSYAVIGTAASEEKLSMPDEALLTQAMSRADSVLIEADGARRLPCKAPGSHEPVILPSCDIVVGVLGLDALGKPIAEVCFRPERVAEICRRSRKSIAKQSAGEVSEQSLLTEQDLAGLMSSKEGLRKSVENRTYYAVLNKCDDAERMKGAAVIANELMETGISNIVVSSFRR